MAVDEFFIFLTGLQFLEFTSLRSHSLFTYGQQNYIQRNSSIPQAVQCQYSVKSLGNETVGMPRL